MDKETFKNLQYGLLAVFLFLAIFITWFYTNANLQAGPATASEIGEALGGLGALFAGLAFAAFLMALFLQMQEFRETRKTLDKSASEARINIIYGLIKEHNKNLEVYIERYNEFCAYTKMADDTKKRKDDYLKKTECTTFLLNKYHKELFIELASLDLDSGLVEIKITEGERGLRHIWEVNNLDHLLTSPSDGTKDKDEK